MNNFDEPVKKAETDAEILDALQGVKLAQDEIRRGACGGMGLAFFRAYPRAGRLAGARGGHTMKGPFRCSDCEHMGLMGRARLTSGTSWGGPRGECWCKHPEAEASFAASGNRSAPCFIAFTAPGGSTPAIKTSPRWCPLKRPGATRSPGKGPSTG